jgi:alpha-galactosidase
MVPMPPLLLPLLLAASLAPAHALQDGVARTPPLGWSTWLSFRLNVSDSLLRTSADFLASSPLKPAGYEYILLDDGWPLCLKIDASGHCLELPPRDEAGRIPVDPHKFPDGFKPVTDYVHSKVRA